METAQEFYRQHGKMSDPGANSMVLRGLPHDVAALAATIQGFLIHRDLAPWLYACKLSEQQKDLANIRPVAEILSQLRSIDSHPLTETREPDRRMPCVCRHFSTIFAAALREHGRPARARCGFGAYFNPGRFEDHWVAEFWNAAQGRWVLVDAQLDPIQRKTFRIDFDPLDVPRDRFIIAGDAWRMCRNGEISPDLFGLSFINEQGLWWIAQNLIRDLAALNRSEMLPWDVWGMMPKPTDTISEPQMLLLDRVAQVTLAGDDSLATVRELYQDPRLRVPSTVFNANRQAQEEIES